jgi:NitT/TauT family transport system substrate-binding protein
MKLKNKLLGGLATASVFLLSACGSGTPSGSSDTANSAAGTPQKVTVGVLPLVATAPIYLGEEKGFFKEEGLDLELQSSEGGAAIVPSVFSGGFQFGYSNTLSILVAADKGLDLRFVTNGASSATEGDADATAVVVQADSDIRSPADLAGKRVSVNTLSNIGDTTIRYVVESDGGDQSSIEFVEVPFPEAPAALANQQVDAAWIAEPFLTEALSHGARVVTYNYRDTDPNLDIGGYFASANTIESNPELVEKFTKAMNKSLAYAGENPDEVREIVGTYTKISEELRQKMILPGFRVEFDQKAASVLAEAATKYGTLSKTPDLEKLLPHK